MTFLCLHDSHLISQFANPRTADRAAIDPKVENVRDGQRALSLGRTRRVVIVAIGARIGVLGALDSVLVARELFIRRDGRSTECWHCDAPGKRETSAIRRKAKLK